MVHGNFAKSILDAGWGFFRQRLLFIANGIDVMEDVAIMALPHLEAVSMPATIDLGGKKFGRLTVVGQAAVHASQKYWFCRCECGTEKAIRGSHLRSGEIVSCGCYHREMVGAVDYDQLEHLLRSGMETSEVADALGIHPATIRSGMAERGVSIADMKFGMKRTPTPQEVSYAAGVFDGEGSVGINFRPLGPAYWLVVSVANTERRLVDWLKTTFGGCVRVSSRKRPNRPCFQWTLTTRQAGDFLALVLPFLLVKREQALLALEFQAFKQESQGRTAKNNARSADFKKRLEAMRATVA
jgi:hypothetical protein